MRNLSWLLVFLIFITISGCEKNASYNYKDIIGTWVSTDLTDTIEFRTEHDFFKTVGIPKDHYYYSLSGDSMTIQYSGALYLNIYPTKHYYDLNGNSLTIDLSNCFGFRNQSITFTKE